MRLRKLGLAAGVVVGSLALLLPAHAGAEQPPGDDGDPSIQIVGGQPATETYSFMVSLQNSSGSHFCGGSLIKPNWVVTAAHCADINPYQVRIGTQTWNSGGTVARVASQTKHPSWTGQSGNDIALLKLDRSVSEQTIPIAASGGAQGTATRLMGWGSTTGEHGSRPTQLQQLDVQVVSGCTNQFNAQTELCLGDTNPNTSACYGDSGGPSVIKVNGAWQLTGATSRAGQGRHPCQSNEAAIYSSVPANAQWISQVTGGTDPGPGPGTCDLPAWRSGVNYPPGAQVSYQGKEWQATWYTWGYPPGSTWGNWRLLGNC